MMVKLLRIRKVEQVLDLPGLGILAAVCPRGDAFWPLRLGSVGCAVAASSAARRSAVPIPRRCIEGETPTSIQPPLASASPTTPSSVSATNAPSAEARMDAYISGPISTWP